MNLIEMINIYEKIDMIKFLDLQKITAKYADEIHEAVNRVVENEQGIRRNERRKMGKP